MIESLFSFSLLFLSLTGWGMLTHNKLSIHPAFIPIFLFSSITSAVFFAGLLNIMPLMVSIIFYTGLLLCIIYTYLIIKKKYKIKELLVPSSIMFGIFIVITILWMRGIIYIHYDNFSHWGLIVKEMFRINGLPDGTTIVTFRNYPPGSAVFIYFAGKIVGYSESHSLMAQGFLIVSNFAALYVFCKWRNPAHIFLTTVISIILINVFRMNIYDLLVDTLLGLFAVSIAVITYYYRNDWKRCLITTAPLLIMLILIKDSGKLLLIINVSLILWFICQNCIKEKSLKDKSKILSLVLVFTLVIPMGTSFLWIKYTEKAYPEASYASNKFAISPDKITNVQKSEDVKELLGPKLYQSATNLESNNFKSILLTNGLSLLLLAWIYFQKKKISKLLVYSTLFTNIIYVLYMAALYLMYLFLMPEGEALVLAGFNRYQATIVIFFIGIMMTAITHEFIKHISFKKWKLVKVITVLGLASIFAYPFYDNLTYINDKPEIQNSIRSKVKNHFRKIASTGIPNPRVVYYSPQSFEDKGYLGFILNYEQLSNNFSMIMRLTNDPETQALTDSIKEAQFIVIVDSDEKIKEYFRNAFNIKEPQGVYKVTNSNGVVSVSPLH